MYPRMRRCKLILKIPVNASSVTARVRPKGSSRTLIEPASAVPEQRR